MKQPGATKKHQKFKFEYWVFSQKSYLNVWCFEKVHICTPKIPYLHNEIQIHEFLNEYNMNSDKGFEPN